MSQFRCKDSKNPSMREHFLQNNPSLSAYLCRFRPSMRDFLGFYVTNLLIIHL